MSASLAQVGYHQRVGEWYRPVALRPLTSSDPGCRLRLVSLSAEAAEAAENLFRPDRWCSRSRCGRPSSSPSYR
eukprot:10020720-Alexandrium_andersonii.AAC.1